MGSNIRKGKIPYAPSGVGDYTEEIYSLKGFFGEWAHLYRRRNLAHPVSWSDERLMYSGLDSGALIAPDAADPRGEPLRLMEGEGHAVSLSQRAAPMPFAEKNTDAHQIRFYHRGRFRLETELGALDVEEGDFVVIPRGLIYRELPLDDRGNAIFVFETTATICPSKEMWDGVGYASLFIDFSQMEVPEPAGDDIGGETEVRVRCDGELHTMTYSHDPCRDVIGWIGDPVLFKMSIWAVPGSGTSRGHLTPPAGCVLLGEDKEFFFNALAMQPFPNTPSPDGSLGAPSHLNDGYDELWLTHRSRIAPEDHLWLLPRTLPHPGFKMPAIYPPNPVREMREMRLNFDTKTPLRWTAAAREALFDDPVVAQYTSFMGLPPEAVPAHLRERSDAAER